MANRLSQRYVRKSSDSQGFASSALSLHLPIRPRTPHFVRRSVGDTWFPRGSRLHIGCGNRRLAGWINADAVQGVGDVVVDLHNDLPRDTFVEIYGSHVLEHCWPQDTPAILSSLLAALLPGGTLRLSVPDLRLVVKNCVDGHAYGDERSALAVIYGGEFSRTTSSPDLHRQAFWKERLERLLTEAGFTNVREWNRGKYPHIDALKDYATCPSGPDGKSLISLNLEADRPGDLPKLELTGGAQIDVSVILGTVDRSEMLKDCVTAVRKSLLGISYEIVVAYGRESDTSLPWMRSQPDIVPILGGMDGAIEAFNRAYRASRGRLICQINDDVIVDGDSIARAVHHLSADQPSSGAVFKFDRGDGRGYRHENFGNTLHPNQMVVRREACEAVVETIGGFWGDAAHRTDKTYGGDSAFGVVCGHLGLRLDSIEGVTCQDMLVPDALRAQNAAAIAKDHGSRWSAMYSPMMGSVAPAAAVDEWPHCYVPRRGKAPRRSPVEAGRPLRVLALPIVVGGWPQTAMRQALARIGSYAEVAHGGDFTPNMLDVAREHKPDLVWAQIQKSGWQDAARELRQAVGPGCTMVQWTGDVRTDGGQPVERWLAALSDHFDVLLADNTGYPKKLAREGLKAGYMALGYESEISWEPAAQETGGAVFIGTNYRQLDGGARERSFSALAHAFPGALSVYGNNWTGPSRRGPVTVVQAGQIVRRAAVTISRSLYNNLERYTSNRLKNSMYAGGVVAVERFPDMEGLGLEHGSNCLAWSGQDEIVAILRDWLRPERAAERQAIRARAHDLAVDRFSWDRCAEELLAVVRDYRARRGLS
jgi:hypothetical protein